MSRVRIPSPALKRESRKVKTERFELPAFSLFERVCILPRGGKLRFPGSRHETRSLRSGSPESESLHPLSSEKAGRSKPRGLSLKLASHGKDDHAHQTPPSIPTARCQSKSRAPGCASTYRRTDVVRVTEPGPTRPRVDFARGNAPPVSLHPGWTRPYGRGRLARGVVDPRGVSTKSRTARRHEAASSGSDGGRSSCCGDRCLCVDACGVVSRIDRWLGCGCRGGRMDCEPHERDSEATGGRRHRRTLHSCRRKPVVLHPASILDDRALACAATPCEHPDRLVRGEGPS